MRERTRFRQACTSTPTPIPTFCWFTPPDTASLSAGKGVLRYSVPKWLSFPWLNTGNGYTCLRSFLSSACYRGVYVPTILFPSQTDLRPGFSCHADKRRSFALPTDAKEEGINAKLVNGVLTVDVWVQFIMCNSLWSCFIFASNVRKYVTTK
jgi:hypothetical protein